MSNERIIIVGGGILTVAAIEQARSMGLVTIVFDYNPDAPGMKLAHIPEVVSTKDPAAAAARALELHNETPISGVTTCGADVEMTVAAIADALGLSGPTPRAAHLCNHKADMRRVLAEADVPGPRYAEIESVQEAAEAAHTVGYPLMVKPMDNCGSRGVIRVDSPADLDAAVETAIPLSRVGTVLLETFVEGTTHTVEMMVYHGEFQLCSIIDTHHGYAPYAVELRHVNPTVRTTEQQDAMYRIAVRSCQVVGITDGPCKVDFLYSKSGPQVMEMTARLSGGFHCQYTTPLAHGTNNIRAAIDVALGRPPKPEDVVPQQARFSASEAVFVPPGRVRSIEGVDEARAVNGVTDVIVLCEEGDTIPEYQSSADRRFFIIASGDTPEQRDLAIARANSALRVETTPVEVQ